MKRPLRWHGNDLKLKLPKLYYQLRPEVSTGRSGRPAMAELNDIRPAGVMDKDMVRVVQSIYPKYDKTLHSKCKRGKEYGILLRKEAINALVSAYAIQVPSRLKGDRHRFTRRISCRLPDDVYTQLQQYIQADGFETVQEWLTDQILHYLKQRKNKD